MLIVDVFSFLSDTHTPINTLRPRQNGRHFADAIFKCIFLNENVLIPIKISLKFVRKGRINNIPALVQVMAWRRAGDKPLSEPMMVSSPTHICITRPQWVKTLKDSLYSLKAWKVPRVFWGFFCLFVCLFVCFFNITYVEVMLCVPEN